MIYTVTLNPALDYLLHLDRVDLGSVNRSQGESVTYGGKGINVSVVLQNLGVPSVALGFLAGFTGREIQRLLEETGCRGDFCWVGGNSRINVKLKAREETEINGQGPEIRSCDLDSLLKKLNVLGNGDILVLAGSIPPSVPQDIYEIILARLEGRGIRTVVDTTGRSLRRTLPFRPFLIKPNHHELGELFGEMLKESAEIVRCAKLLQKEGARNVLVSRAGDGAILVGEDGTVYEDAAPQGKVVNSTGSGDSMVAGFLAGYRETGTLENAFYTGLAAGSASAFSQGLASGEEILQLRDRIAPAR